MNTTTAHPFDCEHAWNRSGQRSPDEVAAAYADQQASDEFRLEFARLSVEGDIRAAMASGFAGSRGVVVPCAVWDAGSQGRPSSHPVPFKEAFDDCMNRFPHVRDALLAACAEPKGAESLRLLGKFERALADAHVARHALPLAQIMTFGIPL